MPSSCTVLFRANRRRSPLAGLRDSRAGSSLVELCVAMLLLVIVFTGWVRMNNIQAVNKESLRYAAIEKAAGMLEAIDYNKLADGEKDQDGTYLTVDSTGDVRFYAFGSDEKPPAKVFPLFGNDIPIGYQCYVKENVIGDSIWSKWGDSAWVRMDLFDKIGDVRNEVDPFASITIFCGKIY